MMKRAYLFAAIAVILCSAIAAGFSGLAYPKPDLTVKMLQVQTLWSGENGIQVGPGLWPVSGPQRMDQDLGFWLLDKPHAWRHLYLKGSVHITRGEETLAGLDKQIRCLYGIESLDVRGGVIVGAKCIADAELPEVAINANR
jgi:hypothetical protein